MGKSIKTEANVMAKKKSALRNVEHFDGICFHDHIIMKPEGSVKSGFLTGYVGMISVSGSEQGIVCKRCMKANFP